jgi:hypothetical protein
MCGQVRPRCGQVRPGAAQVRPGAAQVRPRCGWVRPGAAGCGRCRGTSPMPRLHAAEVSAVLHITARRNTYFRPDWTGAPSATGGARTRAPCHARGERSRAGETRRCQKVGFPAGEVVVQVHHERQLTALAVGSLVGAVVVWQELLSGIVAIKTESLVQAFSVPPVDRRWGRSRFQRFETRRAPQSNRSCESRTADRRRCIPSACGLLHVHQDVSTAQTRLISPVRRRSKDHSPAQNDDRGGQVRLGATGRGAAASADSARGVFARPFV